MTVSVVSLASCIAFAVQVIITDLAQHSCSESRQRATVALLSRAWTRAHCVVSKCLESADGEWGPWHLDQESGENGVNWNERLWPVWAGYKGVSKGVGAVKSLFGSLRRSS